MFTIYYLIPECPAFPEGDEYSFETSAVPQAGALVMTNNIAFQVETVRWVVTNVSHHAVVVLRVP